MKTVTTTWYRPGSAGRVQYACYCGETSTGSTVYFSGFHRVRRYQCAPHLPAESRTRRYSMDGAA